MNKLAELLKQSRICHEFLPEMGRKLQLDAGLFRLVHNVRGIRSPKPIARHFHRRPGTFRICVGYENGIRQRPFQ